ncbi:MAG: ATP synthase F1 subunit gamma [Candidatus Pacebacteria bacterium]|nr:ATP synthase F1 subunit gamma [Candidatus Paceibacterota bacterium]
MQSTQQIRRQIQSTKNTSQITKAMEMVSASKMKKSQEAALLARPYAEAALNLLENVSESVEPRKHILLENREKKTVCLFVVTSDKGLCGGLNSGVIKKAVKIIKENEEKGRKISIVTIGKKAESYFKRTKNDVIAVFNGIGDSVELRETLPISKLLINDFRDKKFDKVIAVYTNFISTLKQDSRAKTILPITRRSLEETIEEIDDLAVKNGENGNGNNGVEYKFEPSSDEVLCKLLPNLIEIQSYHIILESNASEHSARMVAMKSATDSALEMLDDLNLSYNYIRQQKITQEISEISAGVAAQES